MQNVVVHLEKVLDFGSLNVLDLRRIESPFAFHVEQELIDSRLEVVGAVVTRLNLNGRADDFGGADELRIDDVAKLLLGSELVEAWLFQEVHQDAHDRRPLISLRAGLKVGEAAGIRVWFVVPVNLVEVVLVGIVYQPFIKIVNRVIW